MEESRGKAVEDDDDDDEDEDEEGVSPLNVVPSLQDTKCHVI